MKLAHLAELHKEVVHTNADKAFGEYNEMYAKIMGSRSADAANGLSQAEYKQLDRTALRREAIELRNWPSYCWNSVCEECFGATSADQEGAQI